MGGGARPANQDDASSTVAKRAFLTDIAPFLMFEPYNARPASRPPPPEGLTRMIFPSQAIPGWMAKQLCQFLHLVHLDRREQGSPHCPLSYLARNPRLVCPEATDALGRSYLASREAHGRAAESSKLLFTALNDLAASKALGAPRLLDLFHNRRTLDRRDRAAYEPYVESHFARDVPVLTRYFERGLDNPTRVWWLAAAAAALLALNVALWVARDADGDTFAVTTDAVDGAGADFSGGRVRQRFVDGPGGKSDDDEDYGDTNMGDADDKPVDMNSAAAAAGLPEAASFEVMNSLAGDSAWRRRAEGWMNGPHDDGAGGGSGGMEGEAGVIDALALMNEGDDSDEIDFATEMMAESTVPLATTVESLGMAHGSDEHMEALAERMNS